MLKTSESAYNKNPDPFDLLKSDQKFKYQLLGRLQQDCEYYINSGKSPRVLWAQNENDQIQTMLLLYNSFKAEDKPMWLTVDQIENYKNRMCK
jgi:hypothetical protein